MAFFDFVVPRQLHNPAEKTPPQIVGSPYKASHQAVDLWATDGEAVFAAEDSVIEIVDDQPDIKRKKPLKCSSAPNAKVLPYLSRGHYIELRHRDGNRTRYSHLLEGNPSEASVGSALSAGSPFAKADSSGQTCGPHLHFSYYICDEPIDPWPWLGSAAPDPSEYVKQWSVVAIVDGAPVNTTRRYATSDSAFIYSASLNVADLKLPIGVLVPFEVRLEDGQGHHVTLYKGALKLQDATALRIVYSWTPGFRMTTHTSLGGKRCISYGNGTVSCNIPGATLTAPVGGPTVFELDTYNGESLWLGDTVLAGYSVCVSDNAKAEVFEQGVLTHTAHTLVGSCFLGRFGNYPP